MLIRISDYVRSASIFMTLLIFITMSNCNDKAEPKVEETPKSTYAELIRNPLTASGNQDTTDVAKIEFDEILFNFDTITEGDVIKHRFHFRNTGTKPLTIAEARSTCGCTVAEYTKSILSPNSKGFVDVSFDSSGKFGIQDKPISIYANTLPQKSTVRMRGYVKSKN